MIFAIHFVAALLIASGAWLTFAGVIAAVLPGALALGDVLAAYRCGPLIARYTRQLAVLLAIVGLILFAIGTSIGAAHLV